MIKPDGINREKEIMEINKSHMLNGLTAIQIAFPMEYIIDEGVVTLKINSEYSSVK